MGGWHYDSHSGGDLDYPPYSGQDIEDQLISVERYPKLWSFLLLLVVGPGALLILFGLPAGLLYLSLPLPLPKVPTAYGELTDRDLCGLGVWVASLWLLASVAFVGWIMSGEFFWERRCGKTRTRALLEALKSLLL